MKGFSSKRIALKTDVTGWKIYCLQECPCIIRPGNFTGWESEGVKRIGVGGGGGVDFVVVAADVFTGDYLQRGWGEKLGEREREVSVCVCTCAFVHGGRGGGRNRVSDVVHY